MIDYFYSFRNTTVAKIRADWAVEVGEDLKEDTWECFYLRVNSTSCVKLNIIQFKILHRFHYSKSRLPDIDPKIDANCDRYQNSSADQLCFGHAQP